MSQSARDALELARRLQEAAPSAWIPPAEGTTPRSEMVLYRSLVSGTRGYIERVTDQINGAYEQGWYDGCAVMIRRLLETLIIETFVAKGIEDRIKKDGDFMYLRDMIGVTVAEESLNLTRNTKKALPKLKDIGDKSAHSRYFLAHRQDIDNIRDDLRTVVQELLFVSGLRK